MSARNFVVVNSQSVNSATGRAQAAFVSLSGYIPQQFDARSECTLEN
jgi:hypothetical protein